MTALPARVGVVIPAHNEESMIARCLAAVRDASAVIEQPVQVVVVCDDCDDRTAEIVAASGFEPLVCRARNVGMARALGAEFALAAGARWLAFTDADTVVSRDWLHAQLALGADVVCGTIGVDDWSEHGDDIRLHFEKTYRDADGHRHIHGANLGMSARAYRSVGGFSHLANSEDVAIVRALEGAGAHIAWSSKPRVVTSARREFKATAGFGATLLSVASTMVESATRSVAAGPTG
jgi:glycosyltransferase involved in cell wall biosynthesis